MLRLFLITLCLTLFPASGALAEIVRGEHIEAELVAASDQVSAGEVLTVALRLKPDAGWHTYWKNPGDSGLATQIEWTLPAGFEAGPVLWPVPERIDVGPLANYGYHGEVLLLTDIRVPEQLPATFRIHAKAFWLVCEEICIPGDAEFDLSLTTGDASPSAWTGRLVQARSALPVAIAGLAVQAKLAANKEWEISLPSSVAPDVKQLSFFPDEDGWIEYASQQEMYVRDDALHLRVTAADGAGDLPGQLTGLLVADNGISTTRRGVLISAFPERVSSLPPVETSAQAESDLGLYLALIFAFGGGVILNLMPCVFPVVGIKVLTFVEHSRSSPASLRGHGLLFALGVLLSFWVVAGVLLVLRAGGASLGWGYQLQSPLMVSALGMLFFGLALNMSGVFEVGTRLQQLAGSVRSESGYVDAFLSGVIATLVATPCTAPFMGAALGFAVTQPALLSMLVFSALALGMAAPYLVLSFSPRLVGWLPKPGAWMETLKQVLAFPLYLTVIWLIWVLGRQAGVDAIARYLVGLTVFGAGLWVYGRWRNKSKRSRTLSAAIALVLVIGGASVAWPTVSSTPGDASLATTSGSWQVWSPEAVAAARTEGKAVFVDFTAAWCVTCQVNKRLVLNREPVQNRFRDLGVVTMVADWTNRDPQISEALAALGRSGVPVYVVYPAGGGSPILLPELLTESLVLDALNAAT